MRTGLSKLIPHIPHASLAPPRATIASLARGSLLVALASVIVLACNIEADRGEPCYPGDFRACTCDTGDHGLAQCGADGGAGYGACNCTPPVDAGIDASNDAESDGAAESGLLGFLSPCSKNEVCSTGLCFPFIAKGPHCTKTCQTDSDCPPPSPGCSNNKVCKLP
jgi:hypothetical protein